MNVLADCKDYHNLYFCLLFPYKLCAICSNVTKCTTSECINQIISPAVPFKKTSGKEDFSGTNVWRRSSILGYVLIIILVS